MTKYKLYLIELIFVITLGCMFYACNTVKEEHRLSILKGLNVDYILTPENVISLPLPIDKCFEATLTGSIILRCGSQLIELEPSSDGTNAHKINVNDSAPDSYTIDQDGALLTVSGYFFGQMEEASFSKVLPLPTLGMLVKTSIYPGTVYLFGGVKNENNRLYAIHRDGNFTIIVELPDPIVSVTDTKDIIYLATNNEIYSVSPKSVNVVIRLPENSDPITSIEVSPDNEILYYATANKVFALHGLAALSIVNNAGGFLRLRGEKLYLWDSQQKILVCIGSLNNILL